MIVIHIAGKPLRRITMKEDANGLWSIQCWDGESKVGPQRHAAGQAAAWITAEDLSEFLHRV
jgi:hypothetical protein